MKRLILAIKCFSYILKGGDNMRFAFHLAYAIMQGLLKWEDITPEWRPAVKYWLDAYGVGTDGKPLVPQG